MIRLLDRAGFSFTLIFLGCLALIAALQTSCSSLGSQTLPMERVQLVGFEKSPYFSEQVQTYRFEPGVAVTLNAPSLDDFSSLKPTELIIYALPNGNNTAQTIGKKRAEGDDWHFDIQHIGAQVRMLRDASPQKNIVVAYLEADGRSWPTWRKTHTDYTALIPRLIDEIKLKVPVKNLTLTLSAHSGGGSFLIGFLNSYDEIPADVDRIAFLDANYAYSTDEKHADKLLAWLRGDPARTLVVIAYDDREIELNGKKVVGPDGGTFRATQRMLDAISKVAPFTETQNAAVHQYSAMSQQIRFFVHQNPENKILHTALVGEMNGFIHAMTVSTDQEGKVAKFEAPRAYEKFIQDESAMDAPVPEEHQLKIPARNANAPTGSQFVESVKALSVIDREAKILEQLNSGNVPDFLRTLKQVDVEAVCLDGVKRTGSLWVIPDYLAIGSNSDYVRMPMTPITAQKFAATVDAVLPTPKMVDDIYLAAKNKLEPKPLTEDREAAMTFASHNAIVDAQLSNGGRSDLTAGDKKDIVVINRMKEKPNHVAIYGWHQLNGIPIQPPSLVHSATYVDYSHGVRLIAKTMRVGNQQLLVSDVLKDPNMCALISNEGPVEGIRYADDFSTGK